MILRAINLHNFMSYADVRVNLAALDVVCLAGPNGAGKSAILDAVTWSLWESARSSSDELIRLGETEMWVDFEFGYEDRIYRVRRSRQRRPSRSGKKAQSKGTLEFLVKVGFENENSGEIDSAINWRSLTGATMRETQMAVNELLRMDYDTFVNSAYLRQGKADEFTTRLPSERKQVLSEILGLSYFDKVRDRCRQLSRDIRSRLEGMSVSVDNREQIESEFKNVEDELRLEKQEAERHDAALETSRLQLEKTRLELESLRLKMQSLDRNREQLVELASEIKKLEIEKSNCSRQVQEIENLLLIDGEIELRYREFCEIRDKVEKLDNLNLTAQVKLEKKLKLQSDLANMRSRMEVEREHARASLAQITIEYERLAQETRERESIETSHREYQALIDQETAYSARQDSFTRLSARAQELETSITEERIKLEATIAQKKTALEELRLLAQSASYLEDERLELEEDAKLLDRLEAEFELVEDRGLSVKSEIDAQGALLKDIERRSLELERKIQELEEHKGSTICPLCSAPIVDRSAVIGRYRSDIAALVEESDETSRRRTQAEEERNRLRQRYLELKREREKRKDLDKRIGRFNEKEQTTQRARENLEKLETELQGLEKVLANSDFAVIERESLINIKTEIHKLDFDPVLYASLQSGIRSKRHLESRYQQLCKDLSSLARIESELPKLQERFDRIDQELASESYGQEIRDLIRALQDEIGEIGYERDEHTRLKQRLSELLSVAEQYRDLELARERKPYMVQAMERVEESLLSKMEKVVKINSEVASLESSLLNLSDVENSLREKSANHDQLQARASSLASRVAVLASRREALSLNLEELIRIENEMSRMKEEQEDYAFLSDAFGKKGIQAIIIENAVPEIEADANRILSRLSDNRMHIALLTRQTNKSGNVTETLDIVIGDEIGTRNYELFSGGEAFKVNFSIRIALSRLLARRAGARLETLIIDEGFGSQDDQSRERLVRSIKSVQSDFAKIIVITHISDVLEMFPAQIRVWKQNGVSNLSVIS